MPLPRIAGPTRIFDQAQIRRAVELGLGIGGPGQIQFITRNAASAEYTTSLRTILDNG